MVEGDEISGVVRRVVRRRNDNSVVGLEVAAEWRAFIPNSLIWQQPVETIDRLVGQHVDGVIRLVDERRMVLVVSPLRFYQFIEPEPTHRYVADDYLKVLIDNLDSQVDPDDAERYLGPVSARNILVAIFKHDAGGDPNSWRKFISELRNTDVNW
ncbi:MAG: hypothetical protein AAFX06_27005 [Planctomycetota bacterium]